MELNIPLFLDGGGPKFYIHTCLGSNLHTIHQGVWVDGAWFGKGLQPY